MNRGEYTSEILDFIWYLNKYEIGPRILDCGAGGKYPKMFLLQQHGFLPEGVEINEQALQMATDFFHNKQKGILIQKGDMRDLPFVDHSFDGVYSYNTIFHMPKAEIGVAVKEIIRVLKPGGLGYINFIGSEDSLVKMGKERIPGEIVEIMDGEEVLHTVLTPVECNLMLSGMKIIEVQNKKIQVNTFDPPYTFHLLDYFFQKPK